MHDRGLRLLSSNACNAPASATVPRRIKRKKWRRQATQLSEEHDIQTKEQNSSQSSPIVAPWQHCAPKPFVFTEITPDAVFGIYWYHAVVVGSGLARLRF